MFLSTVNCDENSATGQKKTHCEDLLMHLENLYNQVNVKIITSYVRKKKRTVLARVCVCHQYPW